MKQRIVTALLALGLCAPLALPARAAATFNDIPASHWAHSYVQTASNNGWVNGVGNGKYNPNGNVTGAEWYTMLVRTAYGNDALENVEVSANNAVADKWYAKTWAYVASTGNDIYAYTGGDPIIELESNITREMMAKSIFNVLIKNPLYTNPEEAYTVSIPDIGSVGNSFQHSVKVAYSTGIIQGVDSTGKFDPKAPMTRAQTAAVLCRFHDYLNTLGTNTGNYGPVGTVSDFVVTLHYSTHAPTVDYWTDAPQWIKDKTDKDAFNCLAQTLLDPENAVATETIDRVSRNPYYNYAVYENWEDNDKARYVTALFGVLRNFMFEQAVWNPAVATGSGFFTIDHCYENRNERDFEFLNKVNDSMSDREVAIEALKMLQQYSTYKATANGGSIFSSKALSGQIVEMNCDAATLDLCRMLAQVDIPVLKFGYSDIPGLADHTSCYAKLDGEWYIVEATFAVKGYDMSMWICTPEEYFVGPLIGHNYIDIPGNGVSTARYLVDVTGFGRNS